MFGLVVPDKTTKVTRVSAHLKSVMRAKSFSGFNIIRVHDQNNFLGFGIIPVTQDEPF